MMGLISLATIEDVALRAGVSVATVSRVINNNYLVAQEKIDKVTKAMEELDYRPNSRKKAAAAETKMILVVTSALVEDTLRGITDAAKNFGYKVFVKYIFDLDDENDIIGILEKNMFDGVIVTNCFKYNQQICKISEKYNMVECGNCTQLSGSYSVSIDDEQAAYDLTSLLIKSGKRRIAFTQLEGDVSFSNERKRGYFRALYENGIPVEDGLVLNTDFSYESGKEAAKFILAMKNRPDGIVCIYDTIAAGCLHTLITHGVKVPQEIAITGFDNIEISEMFVPKITTISQPFYDLGYESVRTLRSAINGDINGNGKIVIDHKVIVRGSTNETNKRN